MRIKFNTDPRKGCRKRRGDLLSFCMGPPSLGQPWESQTQERLEYTLSVFSLSQIPAQYNHPEYSKPSYTKLLFEALGVAVKNLKQPKCPTIRSRSSELAAWNDTYEKHVTTWKTLTVVSETRA